MLTSTAARVASNTSPEINSRIWHATQERMRAVASGGRPAILRRLRELDEEWDVERYLETVAPTFTLAGLALGLLKDRRFFILPIVVQSFFLQHALQGWCPPLPVLRNLGVRTTQEIEAERCALQHHLATLTDDEPCLAAVVS